METVLVVGATGNIGVAAVYAALRSQRSVLAIVRNQASADKLINHIGSREGITIVEADITSEQGLQGVVDQVKAGKLPSFQHVYSAPGGLYVSPPLAELGVDELHTAMNINFETHFFAYQATVPYLIEQANPTSTWTLCSGAQGDIGTRAAPALSQGALYSFATTAARQLRGSKIRFNEVYLAKRVEVDVDAAHSGAIPSSEFAANYEAILQHSEIVGARVWVEKSEDVGTLRWEDKGETAKRLGVP
ncbi:short-chain dehydrogenase/reductase-like protein SDR [Xylariales sp. PMI_506]|nr:short-chain dehydrogenase/reductase-like protein SDR [Xylariales sp. PMI_506]